MNLKVVYLSFLALIFVILSFFIDWLFLIPAVGIVFLNQKELMKKKK